ncbi:MAG: pyrimidine-nucleoside phosphorylase [Eubacteriales bacterium]|nr:pyrimidine-nucleoside phosphorylase [Eubacteriales bacterium]
MRAYDCIRKKRDGEELSDEEIRYMISSYVKGEMPDYQMSAFLMAIYFQGMTDREISVMTDLVAHSGETVDLSGIEGVKVDKHSTGGVGDKTTLIVAPIVAACGAKVAKMSGRGLGHTGGTIDKLESIPGFRTTLTREEFFDTVNRVGVSVIGQSGNLAPADKKMYALRDVTATVDSIPLIAASIMGKKLAAGNDSILLDVKTGSGAFMKTLEGSVQLARCMVAIGENAGKRTAALITNMDVPLGNYIGNALEVKEAVATLKDAGPEDLTEVCVELAGNMLYLADKGTLEECAEMAAGSLKDGSAFRCFLNMVEAQGGDISCILDTDKLPSAPLTYEVRAREEGYVAHMDTEACGIASMLLGAGRETKDSVLDYSAGIVLKKKPGDYVSKGDVLAVLHASREELFQAAEQKFLEAVRISAERPGKQPLLYARVRREGIEKF